jgi:HTH-type transcriptional repressor of NAD biosynthesis genes
MIRGLVIGKFMPIHKGHVALIEFACSQCDELIVSMSFTHDDPISGDVRFPWVEAAIAHEKKARAFAIVDDFDDESLPLEERTNHWAGFIRRTYPKIDVVVSSEEYGRPFARHLGAAHVSFDPGRTLIPVSASLIRSSPLRYWEFITMAARPYFVTKICIYGAESTGKSTLTRRLAGHYNTTFVPEVAREMLITNEFTIDDIIAIGRAHHERIHQQAQHANRLLFCDTDVITTQIYSHHYLGQVPDVLFDIERKTTYALYFLLDIDVPWVADGLRDLGDRRDEMMQIFKNALIERNIPFVSVRGDFAEREAFMVSVIDDLLSRL